jgi:TldD protein
MFDILEKCVQSPRAAQGDVVHLRGQERLMTTCTVKNGTVEQFSHIFLSGVGVRILTDQRSWGFSSTNCVDLQHVEQALDHALKLARAASSSKDQKIELEPAKDVVTEVKSPVQKPPHAGSAEDIVNISLNACRGAKEHEQIADVKTTYISMEDHKYFVSSEGSRIKQDITRVMLFVNVVAKRHDVIVPASDNVGHTGGLELFDTIPPYMLGKRAAEKGANLLDAKAPPSGTFQVIIHPTLCATLLHEAIGHPLEADLAMAGGGFGSQVGEKVSSELVTIYDDGLIPGGLGYFSYDDEGCFCGNTVLIKDGVLQSFMHDRESASRAGVSPTGNAHAWDYSVEPLIRQTNIGIKAGDYTGEEMIEDITDGLFLEGTFGGQADSNADFTFGFQSAQRIEKGELTQQMRGANVAGNAIEVFKTIDAVSDQAVVRPGACGKFQFAVQGRVVPAIRCRIMVGGTGG